MMLMMLMKMMVWSYPKSQRGGPTKVFQNFAIQHSIAMMMMRMMMVVVVSRVARNGAGHVERRLSVKERLVQRLVDTPGNPQQDTLDESKRTRHMAASVQKILSTSFFQKSLASLSRKGSNTHCAIARGCGAGGMTAVAVVYNGCVVDTLDEKRQGRYNGGGDQDLNLWINPLILVFVIHVMKLVVQMTIALAIVVVEVSFFFQFSPQPACRTEWSLPLFRVGWQSSGSLCVQELFHALARQKLVPCRNRRTHTRIDGIKRLCHDPVVSHRGTTATTTSRHGTRRGQSRHRYPRNHGRDRCHLFQYTSHPLGQHGHL